MAYRSARILNAVTGRSVFDKLDDRPLIDWAGGSLSDRESSPRMMSTTTLESRVCNVIKASALEALSDGVWLSEFDLTGGEAPFEASCFIVAPGSTTDPDRHDVREIWFIAGGAAEVYVDEQSYQVKAGMAILFQPQQVHRLYNSGTEPVRVFSAWWSA